MREQTLVGSSRNVLLRQRDWETGKASQSHMLEWASVPSAIVSDSFQC